MTIEEACNILGVKKDDDNRIIKLKFRKLIAKYHPDVMIRDSNANLKKAQLINEAYALLRQRLMKEKGRVIKRTVWKAKEVQSAFVERVIYMSGLAWEEVDTEYYEIAKGRYEWDPELEEFECFLKSLNEAAMDLLERVEHQNGIYNDYEYNIKEARFIHQVQLFHLLAEQFVSPIDCLNKLLKPESIDKEDRAIYKVQSFLGTKGSSSEFTAMSRLKEGEIVYCCGLKQNRIMISDSSGTSLGHLSLAEDQLYYVLIPILKERMAQVKLVVKESELHKRRRPYQIKVTVDLYLRMGKKQERKMMSDQNLKIADVLKKYELYIRNLIR